MELQKILSLIPNSLLEELAIETEVDVFTKKLHGEVIFKGNYIRVRPYT